jgi:hypothetical protein
MEEDRRDRMVEEREGGSEYNSHLYFDAQMGTCLPIRANVNCEIARIDPELTERGSGNAASRLKAALWFSMG